MRTATITKEIYKFNELSDSAKETAREKWREYESQDNFGAECVIDDCKEIAKIIGIDIDNIYYYGFSSQGDGACFTGDYAYKKGSLKAIKEYAPNDTDLHEIALNLYRAQRKWFYQLSANVSHRGYYYHEYCTNVSVYRGLSDGMEFYNDEPAPFEIDEEITEYLRNFMQWIYRRLKSDYDFRMSDEVIDDNIVNNETEFLHNGEVY